MSDWNDDYWNDDYFIQNMTEDSSYNGKITVKGGKVFGTTVGICVGICILALLLGVAIPPAVIGFFLQIIGVVGGFVLLGKLFK